MKYKSLFLKYRLLVLLLLFVAGNFSTEMFSQPINQNFLSRSASEDPAYHKIVDFVRERKVDDSDSSNFILTANFVISSYMIDFKLPESYKGDLEGGRLWGYLLTDEDGFCEEFVIMEGLDEELNGFVISYFKNMPRISFQKLDLPNVPKGSIKRERKVFPVFVTFISKNVPKPSENE